MTMLKTEIEELKPLLKEVIYELLRQERGWLEELIQEVMEEVALGRAIEAGKDSENVSRDEIFI